MIKGFVIHKPVKTNADKIELYFFGVIVTPFSCLKSVWLIK